MPRFFISGSEVIVLAAPPGTGSAWLEYSLRQETPLKTTPHTMSALNRERFEQWKCDRHSPGRFITVTVRRNVDEWLRTYFCRFRGDLSEGQQKRLPYIVEFNEKVGYDGPDFQAWLDAYLERNPGGATRVFDLFSHARHVLRAETLVDGTVAMLRDERISFQEQKVRCFPKVNRTEGQSSGLEGSPAWAMKKPAWPAGYREKVLAVG